MTVSRIAGLRSSMMDRGRMDQLVLSDFPFRRDQRDCLRSTTRFGFVVVSGS